MSQDKTSNYFLTLPFPEAALSPNARVHWAAKMRIVRKHRTIATIEAARYRGRFNKEKVKSVDVELEFYPKINRLRDEDNALSRCKPYMDGIATALEINDVHFHYIGIHIHEADKKNPRVEIALTIKESE